MMTNTLNNPLDVTTVDPNPFAQLKMWLDAASAAGIEEANAMSVATATSAGRPSTRMVLMRGMDERGIVFYTNYESRKGSDLAENPYAALLFYWPPLGRQVRIEGPVARVSAAESDAYFHSRPTGSRISALASRQSTVIDSRAVLEARVRELERLHGDQPPRPDYWGGYRVAPDLFEFWQSGVYRLHDRVRYSRERTGDAWRIERLSP